MKSRIFESARELRAVREGELKLTRLQQNVFYNNLTRRRHI